MVRTPLFGCAILALSLLAAPAQADEIIVDGRDKVAVGDFDCTGCTSDVTNAVAMLMEQTSGKISAGELWKFFDRQGISSVDELTFCLDLDPNGAPCRFDLAAFQLKIENPDQHGKWLTDVSLGENSLVVPKYEISAFKPEARLKIALGYDFMRRFSAESKETIYLTFASETEAAMPPMFSVEGSTQLLTPRFDLTVLFGFVTFWVMVFVLLSRMTKPKPRTAAPAPSMSPRDSVLTT